MAKQLKIAFFLILAFGIAVAFHISGPKAQTPDLQKPSLEFLAIDENSLLPSSSLPEPKVVKIVKVVITAYSSTPGETDDTPTITAAGTLTRDGVVANNLFPFGTKIRIPELYGNKIFTVEDRMSSKKGYYHFDIWFPTHREAENFGAKLINIEILEN